MTHIHIYSPVQLLYYNYHVSDIAVFVRPTATCKLYN